MKNASESAGMCGETDVNGVAAELNRGNRVLLMVRHAERPKIASDDPTFGMTLPLTEAGKEMSYTFGTLLKPYAAVTQFLASPLLRTRMTAECIARGMGIEKPVIPVDDFLGNSTPYFADQHAVFELFRDGGFFEKIFDYMREGRQVGFCELYEATDRLEAWCAARFTAQLGIFTTHDLYNCAFLYARGVVKQFSRENWTRFLDSAAIVFEPSGARRYLFVRANLSDGITGVES